MKQAAILGAGGMGTALALLWQRAGIVSVRLWGRDPNRVADMAHTRVNQTHLPGATLPDSIRITGDIQEAVAGADFLVSAIPSAFLRSTLQAINSSIPDHLPILSVVKGIERGTRALPSAIVAEVLGPRPIFVLSGPSHAEELAQGLPASVVVAGDDEELMTRIQESLSQGMLRVYTNSDALGVEMAGALKNVIAIAAGVCEGLGLGDNAKAALLTRGLVEMARLAVALGGQRETFSGLAGVGDLLTTCYSGHGRNRAVGLGIGQGLTLPEIQARTRNVAEGVTTCPAVLELARAAGVEMPIAVEVNRVLYENKPPMTALRDLMLRSPKEEWQP